jgi:hypothetical protein
VRRCRNAPLRLIAAPCRSSLASEHGGHRTIQLPAVGARLRANTVGTNDLNRFVRKRTPTAGEGGGHRTISTDSSASGLLQRAKAAGTEQSQKIRPQADSYSGRTRRAPNYLKRFVRKRTPTAGERGVHRTISKDSSASGLLQRAKAACTEQSQKIRPQADSYSGRRRRAANDLKNSSASGLLQGEGGGQL